MDIFCLNDDCLEKIFLYLDLEDQLIIKSINPRFEEVIESIWRHTSKKVTLTTEQLNSIRNNNRNKDLLEYLVTICDIVEDMKIDSIHVEQLRVLENVKFSKAQALDIEIYKETPGTNDDDTMRLSKMFPVIKKLTILTSLTGQYLWLFEDLTDLNITCCEFLKTKHFRRVFSTLKLHTLAILYYGYNTVLDDRIAAITMCRTLEELSIDDHHLLSFIKMLSRMPVLRKVICYTRDYDEYILTGLSEDFGIRMHTMIFHDVFWSKDKHHSSLLAMPHLRRLVLHDDDIDEEKLQEISQYLLQLKELELSKVRLGTEDGLLFLVDHLPQLEILNVSETSIITNSFLDRLCTVVENQAHRRLVPLELRCFETPLAKEFPKEKVLPVMLKVSLENHPSDLPYCRCFQCEWEPAPIKKRQGPNPEILL